MQKLIYVRRRSGAFSALDADTEEVNDYLSDGWKVVMICPSSDMAGEAFVVIEKNDEDDD